MAHASGLRTGDWIGSESVPPGSRSATAMPVYLRGLSTRQAIPSAPLPAASDDRARDAGGAARQPRARRPGAAGRVLEQERAARRARGHQAVVVPAASVAAAASTA